MTNRDEPLLIGLSAWIEGPGRDVARRERPVSYAAALPPLVRGQPAASPDRRMRPRLVDGAWRGLVLDRLD